MRQQFIFNGHNHLLGSFEVGSVNNSCLFRDPWVPLSTFQAFNKIKSMLVEFQDGTIEEHLVKALEVNYTFHLNSNNSFTSKKK